MTISIKPGLWDWSAARCAMPEVWRGNYRAMPLWQMPASPSASYTIDCFGQASGVVVPSSSVQVAGFYGEGLDPPTAEIDFGFDNIISGVDEFTLLAVMRSDAATGTDRTIFGKWPGFDNTVLVHLDSLDTIRFLVSINGSGAIGGYGSQSVEIEDFTVAARLKSDGEMSLFVNGIKSVVRTGTSLTIHSSGGTIDFMENVGATNDPWIGHGYFAFGTDVAFSDEVIQRWSDDPFAPIRQAHFAPVWAFPVGGGTAAAAVEDVLHGHSVDEAVAIASNTVGVASLSHNQSLDDAVASSALTATPIDLAHAQLLDQLSVSASNAVSVADLLHAHLLEQATATASNTVSLLGISHGQLIEDVGVSFATTVTGQPINHAQILELVNIATGDQVSPEDVFHAHQVDAATITFAAVVSAQEIQHAHQLDQASGLSGSTVSVLDITHNQTVDLVFASSVQSVSPAGIDHQHLVDVVQTTFAGVVSPEDIIHGHIISAAGAFDPAVIVLPKGGRLVLVWSGARRVVISSEPNLH